MCTVRASAMMVFLNLPGPPVLRGGLGAVGAGFDGSILLHRARGLVGGLAALFMDDLHAHGVRSLRDGLIILIRAVPYNHVVAWIGPARSSPGATRGRAPA